MNPKKELEHIKRLNKEGAFKEGRTYNRDGSVVGKGQRPNHIGTKPKKRKSASKWSKPLPELDSIIRKQSRGGYSKTYRD